jgi:4-hydroxy-tetrahydrodipicolinate synthase
MSETLKGVWAAALTPQDADKNVALDKLTAHYRWLLANGCDGIAALGTTGEANSFSLKERQQLIATLATDGFGADQIMVGVGCCAITDTVELSRSAMDAGFNNLLMLPPFYYKGVSDAGLFAAYAEVIERLDAPNMRIYVYDFPKMTGLEISTELLVALNDAFPQIIVGVKDSSGRWEDMCSVCEAIPGFGTFAGTEQYFLDTLKAGGVGCITATGNVTSHMIRAVYEAYLAGDMAQAEALQAATTEARLTLQAYPAIPSLKAMMAEHSGDEGWQHLRPPMTKMAADAKSKLATELTGVGFAMATAA